MHPFRTSEEVQERNRKICARALSDPELAKTALGLEFGLIRQTISGILSRQRYRFERNERIAAKFKGVFTDSSADKEKPAG
jgi:hypothetical protein